MPNPHKADLYSFWRWEYVRRNSLYKKHYDALAIFLLSIGILLKRDPFSHPRTWIRSVLPMDLLTSTITWNKIYGFVQRFHLFPFPYQNGPELEELLGIGKIGVCDLSRTNTTLIVDYQTNVFSMRPSTENFDSNICLSEYKIALAWEQMKTGYNRTKHRQLYEAICDLQMLHVANPKFHTTDKEMVARAIGLYLWDKVERDGEKMGDVIRDLEQRGYSLSRTAYSERKTHAAACIKEREVLPFGSKS